MEEINTQKLKSYAIYEFSFLIITVFFIFIGLLSINHNSDSSLYENQIKSEINDLNSTSNLLSDFDSNLEIELINITNYLDNVKFKLNNLESSSKENNEDINSLKSQIVSLEQKNSNLKHDISNLEGQLK